VNESHLREEFPVMCTDAETGTERTLQKLKILLDLFSLAMPQLLQGLEHSSRIYFTAFYTCKPDIDYMQELCRTEFYPVLTTFSISSNS
jgi:hypothetical protein